ncbi:hypothetical protein EV359DRAFT_75846 [Lentinula novae-zelandiae]|nr:hypothetical protein EV359DRAFT_75846 [Lentinula novae-zelandiae]
MSRRRIPGCLRTFRKAGDLTKHVNSAHRNYLVTPITTSRNPSPSPDVDSFNAPTSPPLPELSLPPLPISQKKYHPYLTENAWAPFGGEAQFRLADLLFKNVEMSQGNINELLDIWTLTGAPFDTHDDMYNIIDSIIDGGASWRCFQTVVTAPEWQKTSYQVWYRDPETVIANILGNPEFSQDFNPAPYVHLGSNGTRRWADFMSGNFAWRHAMQIHEEDTEGCTNGSMIVPIILGADKTTVSVATGHVEYHPLYLSIGNVTNADRKYDKDHNFRIFRKKLYHISIATILRSLKPGMKVPVVIRCPDGHFRRAIYDLAAFIADYPEQVYLAGIVSGWCGRCDALFDQLDKGPGNCRTRGLDQILREEYGGEGHTLWDNFGMDEHVKPFTEYFPRADIHEMLSPDILHQIIKGCFKDMLVEWVIEYLKIEHGETQADLRRFPHGRRFKQWTGDDSKALMKIFLPAIAEYLPEDMTKCIASFLDFCYLVRRSDIDETALKSIENAIATFNHYRDVFRTSESRHITAVKKPWRCSNRYNALSQMLLTNQRLDKLSALRSQLVENHLLLPSRRALPAPFDPENEDVGPVDNGRAQADVKLAKTWETQYPRYMAELAIYIQQPALEYLTRQLLHDQLELADDSSASSTSNSEPDLPEITSKINVYHSAVAVFFAPSDDSGIRGMKQECIRCTPSWYGVERRDCVLVTVDEDKPGFRGMSAAHVLLLFSFRHEGITYPCALVHWYNTYGRRHDSKTGLWMVRPAFRDQAGRNPCLAVIHLDTLIRAVHLLPVYGSHPLPSELQFHQSLQAFKLFYVNKYADYHANEILS